jgi:hypothetical protein
MEEYHDRLLILAREVLVASLRAVIPESHLRIGVRTAPTIGSGFQISPPICLVVWIFIEHHATGFAFKGKRSPPLGIEGMILRTSTDCQFIDHVSIFVLPSEEAIAFSGGLGERSIRFAIVDRYCRVWAGCSTPLGIQCDRVSHRLPLGIEGMILLTHTDCRGFNDASLSIRFSRPSHEAIANLGGLSKLSIGLSIVDIFA